MGEADDVRRRCARTPTARTSAWRQPVACKRATSTGILVSYEQPRITRTPRQGRSPAFNGMFYGTAATVIPVLFAEPAGRCSVHLLRPDGALGQGDDVGQRLMGLPVGGPVHNWVRAGPLMGQQVLRQAVPGFGALPGATPLTCEDSVRRRRLTGALAAAKGLLMRFGFAPIRGSYPRASAGHGPLPERSGREA
jgi:hypothetical protein